MNRLTYLIILLISFTLFAQEEKNYVQGQMLVHLKNDASMLNLTQEFNSIGLKPERLLSARLNIWLCSYNTETVEDNSALDMVYGSDEVKIAQFNHFIDERIAQPGKSGSSDGASLFPDDPYFDEQWALHNYGQTGGEADADIDAPEAWDLSQGGPTALGDEVVIAIIDGGSDLDHEDLQFFKNVHEIPGNNIDDDNNGYIDDYDGWNAYNHNGYIPDHSHGTHVAGCAAAVGNNGTGVAGVNLNALIMPIAGSSTTEDIVVEAYSYVHEMRSRFNETNGQYGAFVVVTNASFGVNYGDPVDYPLWCAMYDSLGVEGVLNCGATANINLNVDIEGDVPTACGSDYMIAVTNTTHEDIKNYGAAYGATTIDLGAPGTNIYNTVPGNGYDYKTGTSMASPTVAGAIALMFSAANPGLMQAYKENPAETALAFKQFLLDGVDILPSLEDVTVSGGRLNLYNALLPVLSDPDTVAPTQITDLAIAEATSESMMLYWTAPYDTSQNGVIAYDVRFSLSPIMNDDDFYNAEELTFPEAPAEPGEPESLLVQNLEMAMTYYFAVKSSDMWNNISLISNPASGATYGPPEISVNPDEINVNLPQGGTTTREFNLANVSQDNSTLEYSINLENNSFPSDDAVKIKLKPHSVGNRNINQIKGKPISEGGQAIRGSGGPDQYGYEWIDSDDPEGPEYIWQDISQTGILATEWVQTSTYEPKDEGYAGPYQLGFNFNFYGQSYSKVFIGSNGFVTFEEFSGNTFTVQEIPNSDIPNTFIGALKKDLDGTDNGEVYYKADNNKFIIQYDNWGEFYGSGKFTFQVVIHQNGKILVYYNTFNGGTVTNGTVGIENQDGTDGLQVAYFSTYLHEELAIKYSAEPDWLTSNTASGILYNDNSVDVELLFEAQDFPLGEYSMDVVITSNDPVTPEFILPVTMIIGEGGVSWSADIMVEDAGGQRSSQNLLFGQHPAASDGIDENLGEQELPPYPPAGVFDARFLLPGDLSSLTDLRNSLLEEITWQLKFQPGGDGYPFTLTWSPWALPEGLFRLVDPFGGILVNLDMKQNNTVTVENSAVDMLLIEYQRNITSAISVNGGWNMVSVPLLLDDMSVNSVFPDAASQAYTFDNGYITSDQLENGTGYWLKFNDAATYGITGSVLPDIVPVNEGWNMIGFYNTPLDADIIMSDPSGIIISQFFGFDNGYFGAETINPGVGYWVKTSGAGELYFPPPPLRKNGNGKTIAEIPENSSKLIVTDASGSRTTLYLIGNDQNNAPFELPPAPPDGIFDARFSSGYFAESLNDDTELILCSATYPVKIATEKAKFNILLNNGENFRLTPENPVIIKNPAVTAVGIEGIEIPVNYSLTQNYPNPFNPATLIQYSLPVDASVNLQVYNLLGQKIYDSGRIDKKAGYHKYEFDGQNLSSGLYIYTLNAKGTDGSNFSQTKKMMLMK